MDHLPHRKWSILTLGPAQVKWWLLSSLSKPKLACFFPKGGLVGSRICECLDIDLDMDDCDCEGLGIDEVKSSKNKSSTFVSSMNDVSLWR